jgi:photosystem II stability/assembly factor-like uncharacterized protein
MKNIFSLSLLLFLFFTHQNLFYAQWIQTNGPLGGSVFSITFSGSNIFAGSAGGTIHLSTNNGTSWTNVSISNSDNIVTALTTLDNDLFAAVYSEGIYHSSDNGTNWTIVNSGLTNLRFRALITSGDNLFASTELGGVFISTNKGFNWSQISSLTGDLY